MKKLIYFTHGLSANGIETFLVNVLGKINKSKYDITVAIAIDEGVTALHEQAVKDMGVKVVHLGDLDGLKKKIAYIKNVKEILKNGNYDIVHAHMDLLNGIVLMQAKKAGVKKRICHAHNSKSQFNIFGKQPFYLDIAQKIYRIIMKKLMISSSTELLACSELAAEYFYGDKPFKVIYNGIYTENFIPADDFDREEYAEKSGFEPNKKRIVTVGRISGQKNPEFAVETIAELAKLRNDFQYIWVGTGELENEIKQKSNSLGLDSIVKFAGVRTDVPQILGCCDCFFLPSLFEGLGIVIIEAQAAGLDCVVSSEVPELADCGKCRFVSLNNSPSEWAKIISDVLDGKIELKLNSEKLAQFDICHTVAQLEEIYDE